MKQQIIQGQMTANRQLAKDVFQLWMVAPETAASARPGCFVNIYLKDQSTLLPRPISISQIRGNQISLVYRVAGAGTIELSRYQPGDLVRLSTALGNCFQTTGSEREVSVLIGGGVGVPPLVALAEAIPGNKIAVIGFQNEPFLIKELEDAGAVVHVAVEQQGLLNQGYFIGNVLDLMQEKGIRGDQYFACGPRPMLEAVTAWCRRQGADIQISMEERMGCGYGACVGCTCDTADGRKKVCLDGPVFWGSKLIWSEPQQRMGVEQVGCKTE